MASDGKRDEVDENKERSRKRKTSAEGDESSKRHERKMKSDDEDGKRREKHRHKHRKHKHRSHRKHKHDKSKSDEEIDRVDSAKEDSAVDVASSERNSQGVARVGDETEDGEILDASHMEGTNGELDVESNAPKEDGNDAEVSSDQDKIRSTSPKERDEPREHSRISRSSPDRKRRSRSRESFRDHVVSRHYSRVASPDRKRRRSRSRDSTVRRGDDRITRRPAYSPRTRDYDDRDRRPRGYDDRDRRRSRSRDYDDHDKRRSRSRDYDDRGRYSRKRGDSRDRNYRDDQRYHRNKTAVNRRDREEIPEKQSQLEETREEDNQEEYLERVAHQLAQQEEDIEKVKEESRKRRQAILEKYKKQQQNQTEDEAETKRTGIGMDSENLLFADEAKSLKAPIQLATDPELAVDSGEGIIDPSTPLSLGKLPSHNGITMKRNPVGLGEGSPPKSERSADMFCDIFGESPAEVRKVGKGDGLAVDTSGLTDNWDDADGYYTYRVGEVLDSRYEVASAHGRGVFSTVVRARDSKAVREDPEEVAIKIIRNNETMYKAGQRELIILKKLAGADPENRRHCVRLLSSFEYRNHLCLVFESLHMNLREILKKFGRNIGISLNAVRSYAKQLFIALKHLRNCGVLHCDIKPDNMLVNEAKNVLKLCDFGSAMFAGENEITPYLVSRFYRAPEIILGLPYDHALDIWSVGCCLYELYSGKVLFPGPTNNDMLRLHMELKGPFPKKMLRKAAFAHQHFDQDYNFCATEEDPVTKKALKRLISNVRPKDISSLIMSSGNADEDPKLLGNFKLMLEKIFILDPEKRLTVSQALNHPFITGK